MRLKLTTLDAHGSCPRGACLKYPTCGLRACKRPYSISLPLPLILRQWSEHEFSQQNLSFSNAHTARAELLRAQKSMASRDGQPF